MPGLLSLYHSCRCTGNFQVGLLQCVLCRATLVIDPEAAAYAECCGLLGKQLSEYCTLSVGFALAINLLSGQVQAFGANI